MARRADTSRKPRPESLEARLDLDQSDRLRDALIGGLTYRKAVPWVQREFGEKTSLGGVSGFYENVCAPYLQERQRQSASLADKLMDDEGEVFDKGTVALLKQSAFELMANPSADPREKFQTLRLFLKYHDGKREDRRIAVIEAKAKQSDAAKDAVDSSKSDAELAARMREIFHMGG